MNKTVTVFFILLRAGLWEKRPEELAFFPLSGKEWEDIFRIANRQTVTALVYRGACLLPDEYLPSGATLFRWVAMVDAIERRNEQMNQALAALYAMFSNIGIEAVLQKGQGVAAYYEVPSFRECGDIDIYIPKMSEDSKLMAYLLEAGMPVRRMPDGARVYKWQGVDVEQHVHLIDICNPFLKQYLRQLECKYGYRKRLIGDVEVNVPAPMLDLVLLNTHIMKHALGWGIGIRQICDMARACHSLQGLYDKEEMRKICRKLGIDRWSRLLHGFMVNYLGLPVADLPYEESETSPERLLEIVWLGGNFGRYLRNRNRKAGVVRRKWNTLKSFAGNVKLMFRLAPAEGFWMVAALMKGQLK